MSYVSLLDALRLLALYASEGSPKFAEAAFGGSHASPSKRTT